MGNGKRGEDACATRQVEKSITDGCTILELGGGPQCLLAFQHNPQRPKYSRSFRLLKHCLNDRAGLDSGVSRLVSNDRGFLTAAYAAKWCLSKTIRRLIRGRRRLGMENNGERSNAVERVGEIVLPGATRSEDPRHTRLDREMLSASIPDYADDEVRGACKRTTVSASASSPHFVLTPACAKTACTQPSMSLSRPTRSRCI